ncbi:MAG: hypothetical protein DRP08_04815 [Candidatus Aenigmatarchaeota archaeon]|nr:MAG: hypothetical protein DRP08_04815 [Candidatus Aenigmarchaeota archaeon]
MTLKKVNPGDPLCIPASTFNLFVDAAKDFQNRQRQIRRNNTREVGDSNIILIKNNSGADRNRFDVLGIDGVLFTPTDNLEQFKNQVVLKGVTPTTANHTGKFVILLEPIKSGSIGRAWINGTCPAYINVFAESDSYADVKDGDPASLQSGSEGLARIVWKESGTGLKWAVVTFGTEVGGCFRAKAQEAGQSDGKLSVKLVDGDGNSYGDAFDVYAFADQSSTDMNDYLPAIANGDIVFIKKIQGEWYLDWTPQGFTSITVQTDMDVDIETMQLEKEQRTNVKVLGADSASWSNEIELTNC